jgi:hypothetical protein
VAIFTFVALAYLALLGFWEKSLQTIALLGTAALISIAIGIPLGVLSGYNRRFAAFLRPVLDFMQTMPAFVYLIPVIALFGIGKPSGIIATVIFGVPPVVRLTDRLPRLGRDIALQLLQLGNPLRRQKIGARRQDLAELDEGRPKRFDGKSQPFRLRPAFGVRMGSAPAPFRQEAAEAQPDGDVVDAEAHQHGCNLGDAFVVAGGREGGFENGHRIIPQASDR